MHNSGPRRFKHHQNSTKGPQRGKKRKNFAAREGKKRVNFWVVRRRAVQGKGVTHNHTHKQKSKWVWPKIGESGVWPKLAMTSCVLVNTSDGVPDTSRNLSRRTFEILSHHTGHSPTTGSLLRSPPFPFSPFPPPPPPGGKGERERKNILLPSPQSERQKPFT